MKAFLSALQFLTIIPLGTKLPIEKNKLARATRYFPIIGLILGLILAGTNELLSLIALGQFLGNLILVILLIILTGALHLDGLADTFDALSSGKRKPEMLEIMRDSHIGTMGALSLISIILIKVALLSSLDSGVKNASLVLMCLLSKYSLVFSMFLFPYAREEGKAKVFIEGVNLKVFSRATLIILLISILLLKLKGLIVFIMVLVFVFLVGKVIAGKIGGMTGDTLGAINELTEPLILLTILILTRLWM